MQGLSPYCWPELYHCPSVLYLYHEIHSGRCELSISGSNLLASLSWCHRWSLRDKGNLFLRFFVVIVSFYDIKYPFKWGGVSHNLDIMILAYAFGHLAQKHLCLSSPLGPEVVHLLLCGVLQNVWISGGDCCNPVRVLFLELSLRI